MERQSTSKLFRTVIAALALIVLCMSSLLFASCGSKPTANDGHTHTYDTTPNATFEATCSTPGYAVYACTVCGEQFKVETQLATGQHKVENGKCTKCGLSEEQIKLQNDVLTKTYLDGKITDLTEILDTLAQKDALAALKDLADQLQTAVGTGAEDAVTGLYEAVAKAQTAINDAVTKATTDIKNAVESGKYDDSGLEGQISALKTEIESKITAAQKAITEVLQGKDGKGGLQQAVLDAIDPLTEKLGDFDDTTVRALLDDIKTAVSGQDSILTKLSGVFDTWDSKIKNAASLDDIKSAVQTLLNGDGKDGGVKGLKNDIIDAFKNGGALYDDITAKIAGLQTALGEQFNKQFSTLTGQMASVEKTVNALKAALQSGDDGKTDVNFANIQKWLEAIYKAVEGDDAVLPGTESSSSSGMEAPSYPGAPANDEPAVTETSGMKEQIKDIWTKIGTLMTAVQAIPTDKVDLTELQNKLDALDEVLNGKAGPDGTKTGGIVKQLSDITTALGTIKDAATKINANWSELVSNMADVKKFVDRLYELSDKAQAKLGDKTWDELVEKAASYYSTVSGLMDQYGSKISGYLDEIKTWRDMINSVIDWVTENGLTRNEDGSLDIGGNLGKAITAARAAFDFFGLDTLEGGYENYSKVPMTLAQMAAALTTGQYMDYGQSDHVHNWVQTLAKKEGKTFVADPTGTPDCVKGSNYIFVCSICGKPQTYSAAVGDHAKDEVVTFTSKPGHVTDWTYYLPGHDGAAENKDHYVDATCINPARVEGHCSVCGQPTGQWTTVGAPTYQHHYVLETADKADGTIDGTGFNKQGTCTVNEELVYHCETCGGAYVEKVQNSGDQNPVDGSRHNYYSNLDENGKPNGKRLENENVAGELNDKLDLFNKYAKDHHTGSGDFTPFASYDAAVKALDTQAQYDALAEYLNIVYSSDATCVDPGLTVVECVDCGMRYAYSHGDPQGHVFEARGQAPTCTMYGVDDYFYCLQCGYYFYFGEEVTRNKVLSTTTKTVNGVEGKVPNEAYKNSREYFNKNGIAFNGEADDHEVQVTIGYDPFLGHDFVPVYTNVESCVTAQDYTLVCRECYKEGAQSFGDLFVGVPGTAINNKEGKPTGKYTAYMTKEVEAGLKTTTKVTHHEFKPTADDPKSDLVYEWNEWVKKCVQTDGHDSLLNGQYLAWFFWMANNGYLTRDDRDEGTSTNCPPASPDEYTQYYSGSNVIEGLYEVKDGVRKVKDGTEFEIPVKGHTFNEWVVTVNGVCVMYTRTQQFCTVCGQKELTPTIDASKAGPWEVYSPFTVKGTADAPREGEDNDLAKAFNALFNDDDGSAKVDTKNVVEWLVSHGYFNDILVNVNVANSSEIEKLVTILDGAVKGDIKTLKKAAEQYFGKNVLSEQVHDAAKNILGNSDARYSPLGHTFDLAIKLDAESCNEPGQYVYVCSKCGIRSAWVNGVDSSTNPTTAQPRWLSASAAAKAKHDLEEAGSYISYQIGEEEVKTHVLLLEDALGDNNKWEASSKYFYRWDNNLYTLGTSVPTNRLEEFNKLGGSDLARSWAAAVAQSEEEDEDAINAWLLEHGYFNNVKDTVIEDLRAKLETADKAGKYTAQKLYDVAYNWFNGEATDGEIGIINELLPDGDGATKQPYKNLDDTTRDAKMQAVIDAILTDMKTTDGKAASIAVFYTKDIGEHKVGEQTVDTYTEYSYGAKNPGNTVMVLSATSIPTSGHLYTKGDGTRLSSDDPTCGYDASRDVNCFESQVLTEFYKNHKIVYWDSAKGGWKECGTFTDDQLDPTFKAQADAYGILAACKRQNCPFHDEASKGQDKGYTAGYIAATDHVLTYQKYQAVASGDTKGTPSNEIESIPVEYNLKSVWDYLPEGTLITWTPQDVKDKKPIITHELLAQAKADMDADVTNLYTLQAIWNGLFIPAEYRNNAANKDENGNLKIYGRVIETTDAQLSELAQKFKEKNVPLMWQGPKVGELISTWRPLNDDLTPSCWISLRCRWYSKTNTVEEKKVNEKDTLETVDSTWKCGYKYPDNAHDWPKAGEFDFDSHGANCQHKDLCNTCGLPIGTDGDHHLIDVTTIADTKLRAAWLELLKHLDDDESLAWLKGRVNVDKNGNGTKLEGWEDWAVLTDSCYLHDADAEVGGKETVGEENGANIYVCTGELEKIYKVMCDEGGSKQWTDVAITWTPEETFANTHATANYFVQVIDKANHTYEIRYYFYNDAEHGITEEEWNKTAKFDARVCTSGYFTQMVCVNMRRDGKTACGCVKKDSKVEYEAQGHTLAPIKNYWTYSGRYTPASSEKNAIMQQVCVFCGAMFSGEYGNTTSGSAGDDRTQYKLANETQIKDWNNHNTDDSKEAQMVRSTDIANSNAAEESREVENAQRVFGEGLTVYKDDATIKVKGNGIAGEAGGEVNVLVSEGKTLTFEAGEAAVNPGVQFKGTVAFVGDGEGATVDFSAVGGMLQAQRNVNLVFENMTVIISDGETSSDNNRLALRSTNNTLTFKNSTILSEKTPIAFNSGDLCRNNKIVIEDSVFVSKTSVGFSLWNKHVSVEATRSVFFGAWAGAFIRGGNAQFEDCAFYTADGQKDTSWRDGAQSDVSAAIIIGNKTAALAYGDANVTLTNCDFGLTTADNMTKWGTEGFEAVTPCNSQNPAIAAFSSSKNKTSVTITDVQTVINANVVTKTEGAKDTLTWEQPTDVKKEALGKDAGEQAVNAAKLVESLVANGGEFDIPKIDEPIVLYSVNVAAGTETHIELNNNTLNFAKGASANDIVGDLTITGGTLNLEARNSDNVAALAVSGTTGKLTLDNVTVVEDAGILPNNGGTLIIKNAVILSNHGFAISTNNSLTKPDVTIEITNSTIASLDQTNGVGKGNTGNVGLMVNSSTVKLTATDSTFYGVRTGAWVRGAAKADFTNCKFISGSAMIGGTWGDGNKYPDAAAAALLIGNGGSSTAYGTANVTLTNCEGVVSREVVMKGEGDVYAPSTAKKGKVNLVTINKDAAKKNEVITATAATAVESETLAKKIVLTSYKDSTTTLKMDEASALNFFGVKGVVGDPVIGNEIVLGDKETKANVKVTYTTGAGDDAKEMELLPTTVLTKDELESKASDALTDAAKNGGKVVLPEVKENDPADVTVDAKVFQVQKGKTLDLDLNGNNLKLTGDGTKSVLLATAGGEMVIDGGDGVLTIEDSNKTPAPFGANGEGSKLTIKNTILKTNAGLQGESGATVVLENTTIISSSAMAISTNNTLQPVHYEIRDCKIASYAIGNVALLVNGDKVTVEASNTEFYGTCVGAWVRAAEKATFTKCKFITGSAVTSSQSWGQGTYNPADAKAALLIGDGAGTYGDVKNVTINEGCEAIVSYEWYEGRANTAHNDTAITSAENDKIVEKGGWFEFSSYDGEKGNKLLVIAESGTQTANVNFANADVAKLFGITNQESLVKDKNVYLSGTAKILVKIGTGDPFSPKAE